MNEVFPLNYYAQTIEVIMEKNSRKNELFVNAMSNFMNDKFGVSIDLLDEILKAEGMLESEINR